MHNGLCNTVYSKGHTVSSKFRQNKATFRDILKLAQVFLDPLRHIQSGKMELSGPELWHNPCVSFIIDWLLMPAVSQPFHLMLVGKFSIILFYISCCRKNEWIPFLLWETDILVILPTAYKHINLPLIYCITSCISITTLDSRYSNQSKRRKSGFVAALKVDVKSF